MLFTLVKDLDLDGEGDILNSGTQVCLAEISDVDTLILFKDRLGKQQMGCLPVELGRDLFEIDVSIFDDPNTAEWLADEFPNRLERQDHIRDIVKAWGITGELPPREILDPTPNDMSEWCLIDCLPVFDGDVQVRGQIREWWQLEFRGKIWNIISDPTTPNSTVYDIVDEDGKYVMTVPRLMDVEANIRILRRKICFKETL